MGFGAAAGWTSTGRSAWGVLGGLAVAREDAGRLIGNQSLRATPKSTSRELFPTVPGASSGGNEFGPGHSASQLSCVVRRRPWDDVVAAFRRGVTAAPLILVQMVQVRILAAEQCAATGLSSTGGVLSMPDTAPSAGPNPHISKVIVLAAGAGTRMRSATPKVLHRMGGKPL